MARLLAEIETASGSTVRKIETDSGQVQYQSFDNARQGEGQFLPNQQGDALFEQATKEGKPTETTNVNFTVEPQTEDTRREALSERYDQWNNVKGYSPDVYPSNVSGRERQIISYMSNESLQREAHNDPFVRTKVDERRAAEALAREVMNKIENADTQKEIDRILSQYFDS